jgi:hypothetical protein
LMMETMAGFYWVGIMHSTPNHRKFQQTKRRRCP